MSRRRRGASELTDVQWERISPLLPEPKASPKGGPKPIPNRPVFEGILWILRSGARWKDLPDQYPSPSTCWRRLKQWEESGVWLMIWRTFLEQLDEEGRLDWYGDLRRWHLCPGKKGGSKVGKTKRGKGSKLMVVADGQGLPLGVLTASASPAEVTLIEETLKQAAVPVPSGKRDPAKLQPLIYDRAADSDPLRQRLAEAGIDLICPHRRGRVKPKTQDGRKLRRYKRRWKMERTISWLGGFRRLLTRWEHYPHIFQAFIHVACIMIVLRWL